VAGDRYNYGVNLTPVNVFIDEAAEVVNDPFIQLMNKGRGAGLRLTVATQTFADFAARTGSEAKARQVLGNINNLVASRVLDAEIQQYVTDSLPKTRLKSLLHTQGSTTHSENPLLYTGNVGERLGEEEGDLFPPALLGQLPKPAIPRRPRRWAHRQGAPADSRNAEAERLMPKKDDMPPEGALLLAAVLAEVRSADVGMLRDLELDWPGSRALLARLGVALVAQDPQNAQACLGKCLCAGLDAYRAARKVRAGDQRRFAAFVAGLTEALADPDQQALVTAALSPLQERALRLAEEERG